MHPDNLLVLERLVIALENISQDVKNIQAYIRDINCSMSHFLKVKLNNDAVSQVTCDEGESSPFVTHGADPDASADRECAWQHEQAEEISVVPIVDLEHEEEHETYIIVGHTGKSNVLSEFPGEEEIEEQPECEQTAESHGDHNTSSDGDCSTRLTNFPENDDSVTYTRTLTTAHSRERHYKCLTCDKSFKYRSSLRKHKYVHSGERPYKCRECGKSFAQNINLKMHMRSHTGEKPYECTVCGKAFTCNPSLTVHMRTHTGAKPYRCTECGVAFSQTGHLTKHMSIHSRQKSHSCSECGKAFSVKEHLARHLRTHTAEKPYMCSECGKAFRQNHILTVHMRSHTGEKQYRCTECEMAFSCNASLKSHMSVHSGECRFVCEICGSRFMTLRRLRDHSRRLHAKVSLFS